MIIGKCRSLGGSGVGDTVGVGDGDGVMEVVGEGLSVISAIGELVLVLLISSVIDSGSMFSAASAENTSIKKKNINNNTGIMKR
jgi:hypothetical protein